MSQTTQATQTDADLPIKMMLYPAIIFMILGMIFGVYIAFNGFIVPDYFAGEYVHFGKVRPVHVGNVLFLWLLSADVGLFYYFIPRLCGVPLWSPKLGIAASLLWWVALIPTIYSYPLGTNTGWEYAEFPPYLGRFFMPQVFFMTAWLLHVTNWAMTIATRRYQKMYVSLWYAMGTMIWTTFIVWAGFFAIWMVPGGISRVNINFFYVHNIVGLIFTPMGLATAYYFLPKFANTPIYSHRLSMIGFWTIAFTYAWVGTHHLIHGPVSQWLQTTSIVFSIWLLIPVFSVVENLISTLRGQWHLYNANPAIRFLMMGVAFYFVTCVQGPLMALRNVNEITSKTDWVIGHSHVSLYATFTFFAIAGIYYVIPAIHNKPLWSEKLANWHFSLNLWGTFPFLLALWLGGFYRGMLWATWADGTTYAEYHNHLTQMPFIDTVSEMYPWWMMRAIGGVIILCGNLLFVNIFNTILLPVNARVNTSQPAEVSV
jgi:cytochrome c oxidase cbb3-type subunit 1